MVLTAAGGADFAPVGGTRRRILAAILTAAVLFVQVPDAVLAVRSAPAGFREGRPAVVAGTTWTGRVVVIADGDTIEVMHQGRAVRVRLAGIDAPEAGQAWNRRARARLSELVFHRDVTVVVVDVDRYGRPVAIVSSADGTRINALLVAEGYAWWYRAYSADAELERLEGEARRARRGLWADPSPTPPWIWRKRHPRGAA